MSGEVSIADSGVTGVPGVSRRRVIQGVAWAAPVVVLATAAPALAASMDPVTVSLTGSTVRSGRAINYTINVNVAGAAGASLATGFTVTVNTLFRPGGTWGAVPALWSRSNNVFTYLGPPVMVNTFVTLVLSKTWGTGTDLNNATSLVSVSGNSRGGTSTSALRAFQT